MRPRDYGNKLKARSRKPKPMSKKKAADLAARAQEQAAKPARAKEGAAPVRPKEIAAPMRAKEGAEQKRALDKPIRAGKPFRPAGDSRPAGDPRLAASGAKKTLDRVFSKAGLGSRTDAEEWIRDGRVKVNGKVAKSIEMWVDMKRDKVTLDGAPVREGAKLYILLYKPKGYLTTYKDPEGRPTVYQLLKGVPGFVGTVGRLDLDTSGLLILTNDNQFAEFVTNPISHVPKTYLLKSSTKLSDEQLESLRKGLNLEDGPTRPAVVTRLRDSEKYTHLEITITEGRNRQVRRMIEALGSKVLKLVRVKIGELSIDGMQIGSWRELTAEEVKALVALKPAVSAV